MRTELSTEAQGFLSTPSARRATAVRQCPLLQEQNFYPRPPRGGRPPGLFPDPQAAYISIHALREEGDRGFLTNAYEDVLFLSTPSARRATPFQHKPSAAIHISIHALREEGDLSGCNYCAGNLAISIHALREEGDRKRPWGVFV